jgi:type IV pilus assembly protein PilA
MLSANREVAMAKSEGEGMSAGAIIGIVAGVVLCGGIVVIGILAAIAIPNFQRFGCKSKQAEAKSSLSGLYVAEKSFYAEYDTYTTDLVSLGWAPDGKPIYLYGFSEAGPKSSREMSAIAGYDSTRRTTDDPRVQSANSSLQPARMTTQRGQPLDGSMLPANSGASKDHFLAAAVGNLDGDGTLDVWTIDDDRTFTNVTNDCSM